MKNFTLLGLCLILFSTGLLAQGNRQRVTGRVTDGKTGESLPGASIMIEGTVTGTVTGLDGDYSILVSGGETVLIFSFLGYIDQKITVGDQQIINVRLEENVTAIDEVIVTTQAKGQIGARQQQINSSTIKNVVAPDRLQENPDANAVEAIGRLPGISVIRSGGEGSQIVIRGLEPRYTNITLEGVEMPASSNSNRGTNIGGISQYILQGVEVYKAITPDMEANAVGGTVNLKLQETPSGLHYNVMAQGGYNDLNNYYGNYKFLGDISDRFLNDKLGIFFSANAERVMRSAQTMSASYGLESTVVDILLNSSSLNIIDRENYRQSATLSLDYQVHPSTKLKLYGLWSHSNVDQKRQSKNYGHTGSGSVGYSMADNPVNETTMLHSALTGQTNLKFLNMVVDYGLAYSLSKGHRPDQRSWDFSFDLASTDDITTLEYRRMDPKDVIPLYTDATDSIHNTRKQGFNTAYTDQEDKNLTAYLDLKIPFKMGDLVTGSFKFGGKYRRKERFMDNLAGTQIQHPFVAAYWYEAMPWLVQGRGNDPYNVHSLVGFEDHLVTDFLGGAYDYGWYFNFDMLNATSDWWEHWSDSLYQLGQSVWLPIVGDVTHLGYRQSLEACMIDDQKITEHYYAGYLMGEFNFGRWVMFMPGFRYEQTDASMGGFEATEPLYTPSIQLPLVGKDTSATRADDFFLPMVHMRIKPTRFMYFHLAYTQTISRPDFNAISPNTYINPGKVPFTYKAQNPKLRAELWTNYDAQVTLHNSKIGLLSVSGFYKTVEDKIWRRNYKRIQGDPVIYPFGVRDVVDVTVWENHKYDITLQGMEFEWQTSFWYLPRPLSYFTLTLNYTYTHSETKYPKSSLASVIPEGGGRPVQVRIDTVIAGPMLFQPKHIANASLGFNYKGFNTWLSFQYNGEIFTSKNFNVDELDGLKEHFYRVDLQLTYDIPLKIPGQLQVIGNFANLSNFMEVSRLRGDPRYTYQEAYGWTVDLGARYRF
jgi:TonB-dependent receptor